MTENRLNIIHEDKNFSQTPSFPSSSSRIARKKEWQAKFERLWLLNPEQFDPLRNCMQKERLDRTWDLLRTHFNPQDKQLTDIGCAAGVFSRRLRDAGGYIEAVDIAENALKHLRQEDCTRISSRQDAMPTTSLPDNGYDGVICTEVIANLPHEDFRLFFAELSRLVKSDGYVVCSTDIDIYTLGGANRFIDLAQTEFDIIAMTLSYHALYLRIKHGLKTPDLYFRASKDSDLRSKELEERRKLGRAWFWLNTTPVLAWFWFLVSFLTKPLLKLFKNSRRLLLGLEKICHFFWDESGISHVIFIGQRRPLRMEEPAELPIERPKKRQVWE